MKTKLINIIEANKPLNYEYFYDFDIDKILISYYLPKEVRTDSRTEYLSLFGEEKKVLDGDWIFYSERVWKKYKSPNFNNIRVNDEHQFYSKVLNDLTVSIKDCDHIIVVGTMRNTACVFLKDILDIAEQHNIEVTILYCSSLSSEFHKEVYENQFNYFNKLVSNYNKVNYIQITFTFQKDKENRTMDDLSTSQNISVFFIYDIALILLEMLKKNQTILSVSYDIGNMNLAIKNYDFLVDMFRLVYKNNQKDKQTILKDYFINSTKAIELIKNETR